jgi:hypothetical protein
VKKCFALAVLAECYLKSMGLVDVVLSNRFQALDKHPNS